MHLCLLIVARALTLYHHCIRIGPISQTGMGLATTVNYQGRLADSTALIAFPKAMCSAEQRDAWNYALKRATRWYRVILPEQADVPQAVTALAKDPNIEYAEPDYVRRPVGRPDPGTDPLYNDQWHLDAVNAPQA